MNNQSDDSDPSEVDNGTICITQIEINTCVDVKKKLDRILQRVSEEVREKTLSDSVLQVALVHDFSDDWDLDDNFIPNAHKRLEQLFDLFNEGADFFDSVGSYLDCIPVDEQIQTAMRNLDESLRAAQRMKRMYKKKGMRLKRRKEDFTVEYHLEYLKAICLDRANRVFPNDPLEQ